MGKITKSKAAAKLHSVRYRFWDILTIFPCQQIRKKDKMPKIEWKKKIGEFGLNQHNVTTQNKKKNKIKIVAVATLP